MDDFQEIPYPTLLAFAARGVAASEFQRLTTQQIRFFVLLRTKISSASAVAMDRYELIETYKQIHGFRDV